MIYKKLTSILVIAAFTVSLLSIATLFNKPHNTAFWNGVLRHFAPVVIILFLWGWFVSIGLSDCFELDCY